MEEEEIQSASVALMRWLDSQDIEPADSVVIMLWAIRFVVHCAAEGDAEKERCGREMVVEMFNEE